MTAAVTSSPWWSGGSLLTLGVIAIMFGVVADLIGRNRQLLESVLERLASA